MMKGIVPLILVVLGQIFFIMTYVAAIIMVEDPIYWFGIPSNLLIIIILNIASLVIVTSMYIREANRKLKQTEATYEDEFYSFVASVRSDRHDLNNHLTVIAGLLQLNSYEAAKKYMQELIGDIQINNQSLTIPHPILASMVFSKMEKFRQAGVRFQPRIKIFDGPIMSSTDLIRLVGNLLDNAYEATLEMPLHNRQIELEVLEQDDCYTIQVMNSSHLQSFQDEFFQLGSSTKQSNRGFGLSIIEEIVKRHDGNFTVTVENGFVIFTIQIPKR